MDVNREREEREEREDRAHEIDEALKSVFADADRAEAVKRLRKTADAAHEVSQFFALLGMSSLRQWAATQMDAKALSVGVVMVSRGHDASLWRDELRALADKMDPAGKEAGK